MSLLQGTLQGKNYVKLQFLSSSKFTVSIYIIELDDMNKSKDVLNKDISGMVYRMGTS